MIKRLIQRAGKLNAFRFPKEWLRSETGPMTRELRLTPDTENERLLPQTFSGAISLNTVCGYCSTGCSLKVHRSDSGALGVTPETSYPVNLGMACPKGWEALRVLESPQRALYPKVRDESGEMQRVSWTEALELFVRKVRETQRSHGADSVAFLSSGQICTEEMALLGCVAKFGMGFRHGDGNTRQCMATAVTAYNESFGFDAPPFSYEDLELSDCLVFVGANPCLAHPILWERVLRNRHQPRIFVVDPRKTETAMAATDHIALRPKSDLILLYGIAHQLVLRGWLDKDFIEHHTNGFEAYCEFLKQFDESITLAATGIEKDQFEELVKAIGTRRRVSFWWTMGVNQSYQGTRTAQAIINLALMTGNIGRAGTGANSITGQCNAMGSRLFSNTTNLIGGRRFEDPDHRLEVAERLEMDINRIPSEKSWSYDQILSGIDTGQVRGLWVIGTNPAHSWIQREQLQNRLQKLDWIVVQDMYQDTETAKVATILLPAAGWGEKEGTFINSERRIGRVRKVANAPGEALADYWIFLAIAQAWGCERHFRNWSSPAAAFEQLKRLSAGQPCDITGIQDYDMLEEHGGIQWPWTNEQSRSGKPRKHRQLFTDKKFFTEDQRARFVFDRPQLMPESPTKDYPFLLLTGRGSASQWHTQTRTRQSPILRQLYPANPYVEMHPHDAASLCIGNGELVCIQSPYGEARVRAHVNATVQPGQVFMPMHDEQTNRLTHAHFDPYSRQPSFKNTIVRISKNHNPTRESNI